MEISYKKLWKQLIDRDMTKTELCRAAMRYRRHHGDDFRRQRRCSRGWSGKMTPDIRQLIDKFHDRPKINNRGKNILRCVQGHYLPCGLEYIVTEKQFLQE